VSSLSSLNAPVDVGDGPGLGDFAVGFDPVSRRLILQVEALPMHGYGGYGTFTATTWAWDGKRWTQLSPASEPAPEAEGSMAVDPASGELMYMGGSAYTSTSDSQNPWIPEWDPNQGTWLWNGSTWTRVADNPEQGDEPALAVDQATGQLLASCSGIGFVASGGTGDTSPQPTPPAWYSSGGFYRWTGSGWTPAPTAATPAGLDSPDDNLGAAAAMAYDPISRRLIEFGGSIQGSLNSTLAYDGTTWTTLTPNSETLGPGVPPWGPASAATDEATGQIIMLAQNANYGFLAGSGTPSPPTTWTWTGTAWAQLGGAEPPAYLATTLLTTAQLVWDPAINQVVLVYANKSGDIQVWIWGGTTTGWEQVPS
jgi:hypothetical protein